MDAITERNSELVKQRSHMNQSVRRRIRAFDERMAILANGGVKAAANENSDTEDDQGVVDKDMHRGLSKRGIYFYIFWDVHLTTSSACDDFRKTSIATLLKSTDWIQARYQMLSSFEVHRLLDVG